MQERAVQESKLEAAYPLSSSPTPGQQRAERILELKNLRKTHVRESGKKGPQEDLVVLDDVSFDVNEGEFVTIIGPSGCGKSTLLNIVAGLEPYQGGDIVVSGHRVSSVGPDIVMIFQEEALFPWLSVIDNVSFGLRHKKLPKDESRRVAMEFIDMVQLGQFSHSYIHQLSGGMKQRVAIARGLAMNPRILLMDEPFGALDYRTREILQQQIQEIHEKTRKTILFVTHDVREAVSLGDRVILLTHRPTKIKQQYLVDLARPRSAEDPQLHGLINVIQSELREEIRYAAAAGINGGAAEEEI